ncbi:PAS domain S-box protein [Dyadobacter chenwenxiniae]|uniref:histidine kinase n=1 Tax=Dyadobacter chenwenxiniae TaxID=2906456 RepID=A0A9X1TGH1_9BACT|nr:PAS domain S-box protein [Dyadobacter chenwenxiniae]MCF0063625.1 PAS domain S-box protein [Dyadobacter chenwenxiniae]UON83301.1 PAS domain S-box protein [Dyadobacter chenwenxiniae]
MTNYTQGKSEKDSSISSEVMYRDLFLLNPQPMWVYDVETFEILNVNEAAVRHYGYSRDEFLRLTIKDLRPAAEIATMVSAVEIVRMHDKLYSSGGYKHQKKNGEIVDVNIQSNIIYIDGRKAELVLSTDITEKCKTDEKFKAIFEHTQDAIMICDDDGNCLDYNTAVVDMFGYSRKELDKISLFKLLKVRAGDLHAIWTRFLKGKVRNGKMHLIHKDGSVIIGSFNVKPNILPGMHLCVVTDITEKVLKSKALILGNERYKLILNAANEAIYDWDIERDKVEWGTGFKDIFGYDLAVYNNHIWSDNIYYEDKERVIREISAALNDPGREMLVTECRYVKFDQKVALVEHRIIFLRNVNGKAIRAVGSVRDITDYKQSLHRIQLQNEQLREIAWIQSHVVRAPLTRMMGLVELLKLGEYGDLGKEEILNLVQQSAAELDSVIKEIVNKADKVQTEDD